MPRFPMRYGLPGFRALALIMLLHSVRPDAPTSEIGTALGLPGTVARALNRIRESNRDQRLTDDLWLERLPFDGGVSGKSTSSHPPTNLLELADAVFDTHRLSWRNAIVPGVDFNVCKDQTQKYRFYVARNKQNDIGNTAIRTFGIQRRRMQLIMLPIMYKLGVITTLLTGLTVLSLKGVTIGVILLMLAITSIVARLSPKYGAYGGGGGGWYAAASPWSGHDPFDRSSSQHAHQPSPDKNIHVHVHTAPGPAASLPGMMMYKGSSPYDRDGPLPPDDGGAVPYWNRGADDYYDNPNNNYYYHSRPINNGDGSVDSTTVSSVYHRWLG